MASGTSLGQRCVLLGVWTLALPLVSGACDGADPSQRGDSDRAEGSCTAASVQKTLQSYYRSLSEGRIGDAMAQVAPKADFVWYSVGTDGSPGARDGPASQDRATLDRYLARRASADETWSLRTFSFTDGQESDDTGDFQMTLRRTATDIGARQTFRGKGALDCSSRRIIVISIEQVR
jgi:hypothetical protein